MTLATTPFAVLLRQLRVRAGLSQNQLARRAGVDPAYVNRMEHGSMGVPSRRVALSLCAALQLSPHVTDRLLYAAGLAPQEDWQTRATRAEIALETLRAALAIYDDVAVVRRSA